VNDCLAVYLDKKKHRRLAFFDALQKVGMLRIVRRKLRQLVGKLEKEQESILHVEFEKVVPDLSKWEW
jgi:hypothetical protein